MSPPSFDGPRRIVCGGSLLGRISKKDQGNAGQIDDLGVLARLTEESQRFQKVAGHGEDLRPRHLAIRAERGGGRQSGGASRSGMNGVRRSEEFFR